MSALPTFSDVTVGEVFMDSALSYSGAPATVFSGLDHLEGLEVVIVADKNVVTGKIVASGAVTLDEAASVVHIGLPYSSRLKTMQLEYDASGTPQGRKKKISKTFIRLENTRALFICPSEDHLVEVKFRVGEDLSDPVETFTGDKSVNIDPRWGTSGELFVKQTAPLPISVLALIPEIETSASA